MSAPTAWLWTIYDTDGVTVLPDGVISGSDPLVHQNPSYTFPAAGSYFVRSQPSNVHGSGDTGLVAVPVTEPGAFSHKATDVADVDGGTTSTTATIQSIAVGDLIVVHALGVSSPGGIASVSDGLAGNTYAPVAATQQIPGGGHGKNRTFWCVAVTGGTNVPLVVTYADATVVGSQGSIVTNQYVHTGTVSLFDHKESSGAAVGGPVDPGSIVANVGNLLLLGSGLWNATVPALPIESPPPWTARFQSYVADRLNLPAGTYTYRPTYAGAQSWIAQLIAFTTDTVPSPGPPTVSLTLTTGNPATSTPYQYVANTTGTVDRVGFKVDGVLVETRTVAPYLLFDGATGLLGAGQHTILAEVFEAPGGTPDDTDSVVVTEPGAGGTHLIVRELCERVPDADSYNFYVNGTLDQPVPQPPTGNPHVTFIVTGADADTLLEWTSVKASVESARAELRERYTDPSASAIEGLTEVSRVWDGTNWVVRFRCKRKPAPCLSYNQYRDGSVIQNVVQPASGDPTFIDTFTGASVSKIIGVAAVYAGPVDGPRASARFTYLAPATGAPKGGKEISRTYTP